MTAFVIIDRDERASVTHDPLNAAISAMAGDVVLRNRGPDCFLIEGGFRPVLAPALWRRARAERSDIIRAAFDAPLSTGQQ